jgi:hypothetical protein
MGDAVMASSIRRGVYRLYAPVQPVLFTSTDTLLWTNLRADMEVAVDRAVRWPVHLALYHGLQDRDHPSLDKFLKNIG